MHKVSFNKFLLTVFLVPIVSGCDIESILNMDDSDFYYDDEKCIDEGCNESDRREKEESIDKENTSEDSGKDSYEDKIDRIKEVTSYDVIERMDSAGSYDLIGGYEPVSEAAIQRSILKWADGNTNVFLRDYKAHTVEIRKTLGNTGLQEMRIKFVQNPSGAPLNRRISDVLNEIADAETIETCGVNAKPLIIYNKPSFEVKQATSFYKPEIVRSQYIREYAYRCLY